MSSKVFVRGRYRLGANARVEQNSGLKPNTGWLGFRGQQVLAMEEDLRSIKPLEQIIVSFGSRYEDGWRKGSSSRCIIEADSHVTRKAQENQRDEMAGMALTWYSFDDFPSDQHLGCPVKYHLGGHEDDASTSSRSVKL
ncbi:hypothetical protein PM082_011237 [Marasmius tenuissimus]|nr:hypothetical protein PM082_011237 [Marasmius tenuissimus]